MDFFISAAQAQQAGSPPPGAGFQVFMIIGLIVMFYFMLIRPQSKRNKEHRQMVEKLAAGDEVVTNGGIAGTVTEVGENYMKLTVADGVVMTVQKQAVGTVLPKGSLDSL